MAADDEHVGAMAALFQSLARWATPKGCCSSMTTKPRLANRTVSSDDGVGAYGMWMVPSRSPAWISPRSLAGGGSCEQPDVDSDCSGESG